MAASAGRARELLVSRWRFELAVATARTASLQSRRLRYSAMYCHEIRAHLRCLKIGDTGSSLSVPSRMSAGSSSSDWLRAMGSAARKPGSE